MYFQQAATSMLLQQFISVHSPFKNKISVQVPGYFGFNKPSIKTLNKKDTTHVNLNIKPN